MSSPTNARAAPETGSGGDEDAQAARRAAALLEASPGIYTLRKRKRVSMDEQDGETDGDEAEPVVEKKQVEQKGKKGVGKKGGKGPTKGKAPAAKKARTGLFAREDQPPAQGPATAEAEDVADDSSLTSLSDLDEPVPANNSSPARSQSSSKRAEPKPHAVDAGEDDDFEQDAPNEGSEDDDFDPSKPGPSAIKSKNFGARKAKAATPATGKVKGKKRAPAKKKASAAPPQARLPLHTEASPGRPNGGSSRAPASVPSSKHLPRIPSDFRTPSMPSVMELYERREEVLQHARLEATRDASLQIRSEDLVATALESLETGSQQTALSLAMNRYSSFCAHPSVDIPPFLITPTKVSLFLSRVPTGVLPSLLLSVFPQPDVYPVPVAGVLDPNLTPDESTRVTQELVRCWVDAYSYAQMATRDIWDPVLDRDRFEARAREDTPLSQTREALHPSLRPIKEDFVVREIIAAVESFEHMRLYEEKVGTQRAAAAPPSTAGEASVEPAAVMGGGKGKTKWTKGGKAVAAPSKSNTPTTPRSRDGAGTPVDSSSHGSVVAPPRVSLPPSSVPFDLDAWNGVGGAHYPQIEAQLPYMANGTSTSYSPPSVVGSSRNDLFPVATLHEVPLREDYQPPVPRRMSSPPAATGTSQSAAGVGVGFTMLQHDAYNRQSPYEPSPSAFARSRHASHDPRLQTVGHAAPSRLPMMQPALASSAMHIQRGAHAPAQGWEAAPFAEGGSSSTSQPMDGPASWAPSHGALKRRDSAIDLLGEAASVVEAGHEQQAYAGASSVKATTSFVPSTQRTVPQPAWSQSNAHDSARRIASDHHFDPSNASQRPKLYHQPASFPFATRTAAYAHPQLPYIDEGVVAAPQSSHLPPTPYSAVQDYEFDQQSHTVNGYTTQQYHSSSTSHWRASDLQVNSYTASHAYPTPGWLSTGQFAAADASYQGSHAVDDRSSFGAAQGPAAVSSTAPLAPVGLGIQLD